MLIRGPRGRGGAKNETDRRDGPVLRYTEVSRHQRCRICQCFRGRSQGQAGPGASESRRHHQKGPVAATGSLQRPGSSDIRLGGLKGRPDPGLREPRGAAASCSPSDPPSRPHYADAKTHSCCTGSRSACVTETAGIFVDSYRQTPIDISHTVANFLRDR